MLELTTASLRSALRAHPGLWLLCAALVFGAGIACSGDDFDGDTGADADLMGTWSIVRDVSGDCDPFFARNGVAIDQDGDHLVLMFDPDGFARAELSGSGVEIDYAFSDSSTLTGSLLLSLDGETLTGTVTLDRPGDCTQVEDWTATRTSTQLPAASGTGFDGTWDVIGTFDAACPSGETTNQLMIAQAPNGDVTIDGFVGSPVSGFVTGDFLRAQWQASGGGSTLSFDAVFEWTPSFPSPSIAGDVSFLKSSGIAGSCEGSDFYLTAP
jgi:hypothetical protein